jgi:hypothetical protein
VPFATDTPSRVPEIHLPMLALIMIRIGSMTGCPRCHSDEVHQSRRKGIVERLPLTLLFLRPFRCEICDLRFYRSLFTGDPSATRPEATS